MPPGKYGRPRRGWVLLDDLDEVRARIARDEAEEAAAAAAAAAAAVSAQPQLPEPEVSGAADDGGAEPLASPPPPAPRPPRPAPKPAPPARAPVPVAAARPTMRPAEPATTDEVDWGFWLMVFGVIVCAIVVGAFVWWVCAAVSEAVDGFETWLRGFFHPQVPAYEPCNRGNPFCRY